MHPIQQGYHQDHQSNRHEDHQDVVRTRVNGLLDGVELKGALLVDVVGVTDVDRVAERQQRHRQRQPDAGQVEQERRHDHVLGHVPLYNRFDRKHVVGGRRHRDEESQCDGRYYDHHFEQDELVVTHVREVPAVHRQKHIGRA